MKFNTLGKAVGLAALVATMSSACNADLELAKREYTGPVTIKLIQEGRLGFVIYTLEVRDSTGKVIGYME